MSCDSVPKTWYYLVLTLDTYPYVPFKASLPSSDCSSWAIPVQGNCSQNQDSCDLRQIFAELYNFFNKLPAIKCKAARKEERRLKMNLGTKWSEDQFLNFNQCRSPISWIFMRRSRLNLQEKIHLHVFWTFLMVAKIQFSRDSYESGVNRIFRGFVKRLFGEI